MGGLPANNINKYGLPSSKINRKLNNIRNNTTYYRPNEIARDLVKLAFSIDPQATVNAAQAAELATVDCNK